MDDEIDKGVVYDIHRPWLTLDNWQKDYINSTGNCFLLTGRQVGKSTAMSIKCARTALMNPQADILVIALTERQAYELFFKVLNYLEMEYPREIKRGNDKPTKHEIRLKNGAIIRCHPTGLTGAGLRTYTITHLFVDEGSRIDDEVFTAVTPMLSVTGGVIDIASTPCGKAGYFFECSKREDFKKFYISAEDCPRHKKEHLEMQKANMSEMMYAQEYLAVFLDELKRLFNDELIKKCCILKRRERILKEKDYFIGCDIARLGLDESTFEVIDKINNECYEHVENLITTKQLTTQTTEKILELNKLYDFKKIGIDSGGVGAAIFDNLLTQDETKRKVVALDNSRKSMDNEDKSRKKLMKEDMYFNLLYLMEKGKIKLLDDDELFLSLKSIQYEYIIKQNQPTYLRISGNYSHIVEGLIRACWLAEQGKDLNLWVHAI